MTAAALGRTSCAVLKAQQHWSEGHDAASAAVPVPHGVRCLQNARPVMEDAHVAASVDAGAAPGGGSASWSGARSPAGAEQQLAVFGVFDGHGGPEVAQHAAVRLPEHFAAAAAALAAGSSDSSGALDALLSDAWPSDASTATDRADSDVLSEALDPELLSSSLGACSTPNSSSNGSACAVGSPLLLGSLGASAAGGATGAGGATARLQASGGSGQLSAQQLRSSQRVARALREAFIRTDAELAGTEVGEVVGSTALVAVVSRSELFVGHCGDSRAVLCRKGVAIPLTEDHKPGRADELARVSALGGRVVHKGGSHRVMGLLAMSRALGDHVLRPYVIPEPEVLSLQRCPDDELLLLATDGLWDVFSCQEAATLALRSVVRARERGASAAAACRVGASVLARAAVERGSRDNITVAVIDLRSSADATSSVASLLASQCSDLPWSLAGGGPCSRKRRSSGSDEPMDGAGGAGSSSSSSSDAAGSGVAPARSGAPAGAAATAPLPALGSSCSFSAGSRSVGGRHSTSSSASGASAAASGGWAWTFRDGSGPVPHVPRVASPEPQQPRTPAGHIHALSSTWAAAAAAFAGGGGGAAKSRPQSQPGPAAAAGAAAAAPGGREAAPTPAASQPGSRPSTDKPPLPRGPRA